jgi:hypothetical protein
MPFSVVSFNLDANGYINCYISVIIRKVILLLVLAGILVDATTISCPFSLQITNAILLELMSKTRLLICYDPIQYDRICFNCNGEDDNERNNRTLCYVMIILSTDAESNNQPGCYPTINCSTIKRRLLLLLLTLKLKLWLLQAENFGAALEHRPCKQAGQRGKPQSRMGLNLLRFTNLIIIVSLPFALKGCCTITC